MISVAGSKPFDLTLKPLLTNWGMTSVKSMVERVICNTSQIIGALCHTVGSFDRVSLRACGCFTRLARKYTMVCLERSSVMVRCQTSSIFELIIQMGWVQPLSRITIRLTRG